MTLREQIAAMSVPADSTLRQAMRAIERGALGVAFLIDPATGRFQGLLTDGDVRRALLDGLGLQSPVQDVPHPAAKVARVGMSLTEVAALFSEPVRVVPLLDGENRVADIAVFDQRVHLPIAAPTLGERELQYVSECILSGWISSAGPFVKRFEQMCAAFAGTRHAVSTSSGTTALHLALLALGIGPGDEVIVPTLTFVASANTVRYTGATPVLVDSERSTWTLDPAAVEAAITPRTKAIMVVHLYGHPADMDPILALARRHELAVIEDAAEAHGAEYRGKRVGGIGDIGVFSFYGNKIVTTGEGGMVMTNRDDLAASVQLLRDHGMSPERRYWHEVLGYNYRLTNLQAAVGVAQMEKIEDIIASKRSIARAYAQGLRDVPGVELPPEAPWAGNVFWLYSILLDPPRFGCTRDVFMEEMRDRGIDTRPLFPPVHTQPIYATGQSLPVAEDLAARGVSLPSSLEERVQHVISALRDVQRLSSRERQLAASLRS
jgi:perosamine synthetase